MSTISICYAANRQIGLDCLKLLIEADIRISGLLLPEGGDQNDAMQLLLPSVPVSIGTSIDPACIAGSDYLISVHFPHIISSALLDIPSVGALNLHPAYLPWNRGWHTPTWAIYDGTPYGATLHWIDEGLDTGPIALQERIDVLDTDTADALYKKALAAEVEVFAEAIPLLLEGTLSKTPQEGEGTSHKKKDLASLRELSNDMTSEEIERRTRSLTTNNPDEAAFFTEQ